jgi:hypothetical protein
MRHPNCDDSIMRHNTASEKAPTAIRAGAFRFERLDFFGLASTAGKEPVQVEL